MEKELRIVKSPSALSPAWDELAVSLFQKRAFLNHLHRFNPCNQRYYELHQNDIIVSGAVVYTLRTDLFTFSGIKSPMKMRVIGLPVSVATESVIGSPEHYACLLEGIVGKENGLILGINFMQHHSLPFKARWTRTLPTVVMPLHASTFEAYLQSLRHPYRRHILNVQKRFAGVTKVTNNCRFFTPAHYDQYLQIMRRTKTKLETLSFECFSHLPANFRLTTYFTGNQMLCWHIVCRANNTLIFYFGGMNYALNKQYASYQNLLLDILLLAIEEGCRTVEFGQTAETAKQYLGGELSERALFLYHRNPVISGFIKLFKPLIGYRRPPMEYRVFKKIQIPE